MPSVSLSFELNGPFHRKLGIMFHACALLIGNILLTIHFSLNSLLSSSPLRVLPWPNKDHVAHSWWSKHGRVFHLRSIIMVVD